jgi:molybdate transport system substrate-binding protein
VNVQAGRRTSGTTVVRARSTATSGRAALLVPVLAVALALAGCSSGAKQASKTNPSTTPSTVNWLASALEKKTSTTPSTSATIAIFAPTALGDVLQLLSAAYKTAHPGITFQITTGDSNQLQDQLQKGTKPNIYIDDATVIARLAKGTVTGKPARFGSDFPVAVVKKGNPKQIHGLSAFGAAPGTTSGVCTGDSDCATFGKELLQKAGITPIPDIEEADEATLVNEVAVGNVDVGLVMRSASRSRFFKLQGIPLWFGPHVQVDYDIAAIQPSTNATDFASFATTSSAGRTILVQRGYLALGAVK